ncbi:uncharacterized protein TNCV_4605751 [Trichonephila clavipes]|nr:uncharacterized protein TNCV_4605751 [Trichonephila clavipes]
MGLTRILQMVRTERQSGFEPSAMRCLFIHLKDDIDSNFALYACGDSRNTTEREDCRSRRTAVEHHTASAAEIRAAVGNTMTQKTVRNRLLQGQLRSRCPVACILLTPSHSRLRCQWCQARAHRRMEWRSVVFSDESRF